VLWGFAAYRFSASPQEISVTVLCWSAPPAVLSPLTGALADRFGPRAMMIAGYLGAAAGPWLPSTSWQPPTAPPGPCPAPGTLGRVMGVISTAESATETVSMPLAGAILAVAGIRPGALALAAVAVAAGATCLRW
jgi:MFS family permease